MGHFRIDELVIPASIDASDAADFIEMTRMRNEVEADIVGNYDLAVEPVELLPVWLDPYESRRMFVARVDGRIVGRGTHEVQSGDDVSSAWLSVEVLPAHRYRGIGSALYDTVAAIAAEEGRPILQSFTSHDATSTGERVASPTGFGTVPRDDDGARFLLKRGYRLAQVERTSRLELPVALPPVKPPVGYDVVLWEGPTPEHRLADLAVLHAAMSTDPPLGEVDYEPEVWDEERVRVGDRLNAADSRRWLTAAARHVASDTLVGFTQLTVPLDSSRPAFQQDTIVSKEHRGHRLGMLIKVANLAWMAGIAPDLSRVYTWNAEENTHMLAVNEAVGFSAIGYAANWRHEV